MKGRLMRNKVLGLLLLTLFILSVVLGCSNKHKEVNTDKLEKRTSVETSQPKEKQNISEGTLTYTNLNSKSSIDEVKSSLKTSEIRSEYADRVLEWVADYNNCMRNCDEFSLTGDFITVSAKAIDYGDYSKMSREWFRRFVSSTRWQISLPFSFIIVFLFFCITNKPRLCTEQIFFFSCQV